jgi:hypothetical protein
MDWLQFSMIGYQGVEHEEFTRLDSSPDQHVYGIIGCLGAATGRAVLWTAHVGWRMVDVFGAADDDRFHRGYCGCGCSYDSVVRWINYQY